MPWCKASGASPEAKPTEQSKIRMVSGRQKEKDRTRPKPAPTRNDFDGKLRCLRRRVRPIGALVNLRRAVGLICGPRIETADSRGRAAVLPDVVIRPRACEFFESNIGIGAHDVGMWIVLVGCRERLVRFPVQEMAVDIVVDLFVQLFRGVRDELPVRIPLVGDLNDVFATLKLESNVEHRYTRCSQLVCNEQGPVTRSE